MLKNISNFKQELDMQHAAFTTTFDYGKRGIYQIHLLFFTAIAIHRFLNGYQH